MILRWVWLIAVLGASGCDDVEPCDRYIDYMCACHGDDPGFDCEELENTYQGADAAVQDECALELSDQRDDDDEAGLECDA